MIEKCIPHKIQMKLKKYIFLLTVSKIIILFKHSNVIKQFKVTPGISKRKTKSNKLKCETTS